MALIVCFFAIVSFAVAQTNYAPDLVTSKIAQNVADSEHTDLKHGAESKKSDCELLGKAANVEFPGVKLKVHYIDEHNLHWKTDTNEAYETISYAKLAPHIHFLNWIEKDGLTVSHIVDCESNTVQSFLSWQDAESPRGARSGALRSGTITFDK